MLLPYMVPDVDEAGCDEAGRGCLCGPVVCAAVILPPDFVSDEINDSKQLTEARRERLAEQIRNVAVAWAVEAVSAEEIDRINILNASIVGMHRVIAGLKVKPRHIIVDGNRFKPYVDDEFHQIPHHTVVKGDAKYLSIAAASILAKTTRDAIMRKLSEEFPGYGWERNMGYPTKEHREALKKLGVTPHHRRSYAPVREVIDSSLSVPRGVSL